METYIKIKVDTNDADYNMEFTEIDEETLSIITPLIEAIKNFKPFDTGEGHTQRKNFPFGECLRSDLGEKSIEELYVQTGLCTEEALDIFLEMLPYGEYGFHTIESIEIFKVSEKIKLL